MRYQIKKVKKEVSERANEEETSYTKKNKIDHIRYLTFFLNETSYYEPVHKCTNIYDPYCY